MSMSKSLTAGMLHAQAGAAGTTASAAAYLRSRYFLDPGTAYRAALLKLNTSPAILEVCSLRVSQQVTSLPHCTCATFPGTRLRPVC
jgi:hypothetical protein